MVQWQNVTFPRSRHGFDSRYPLHADVAQLVEQYFRKVEVGGSNPLIGSTNGVWRSLVARIVRDDEVAGSNPVTPTIDVIMFG